MIPLRMLTVSPGPRKGRRPTLILRTQLSVRVHAIIGESSFFSSLCPSLGGGLISAMSFGQGFCDGRREQSSPGLLLPRNPSQRFRDMDPMKIGRAHV